MDKIICLVGASGTGKTTIAKELDKLGYNIIHSYTTREPREENEWGHIFIPHIEDMVVSHIDHSGLGIINIQGKHKVKCKGDKLIPYIYYNRQVFAHKELYGEHYWATKDQYKNKGTSIYIVDPEGAKQTKQVINDAEIITIFLTADEEVRRKRMVDDKERKYPLVTDRLRQDYKIFSKCKCDYVIDANRDIQSIITDIVSIIGDVDE